MSDVKSIKTRFGTYVDQLLDTEQNYSDKAAIAFTIWRALVKPAVVVMLAGSSCSMTAMTVKEFLSKPVLNATAHTQITQIFDGELTQIETTTAAAATEAEILSYNPTSAVVWPRCPTPTCFNKNVTEQTNGSFLCGASQRREGCGGVATIAVMVVVDSRLESFDQYKIFTKAIGKLFALPKTFSKEYDLSKEFDMLQFPLSVLVRPLTNNTAEKALEVEQVLVDLDGKEDEEL
uniref:Uncharacterized protein n=1 Tax=Plectus sambesii TaxID=2011161 RepID=A0A914XC80_9BILA